MNTDSMRPIRNGLTDNIIKAFHLVYNNLGYGFREEVYEKALMVQLERLNVPAQAQRPIQVFYDGAIIGEYSADILVDEQVIVEVTAVKKITTEHESQLVNYLKATNIEVGLLLNFGPKAEIKRKLFDNWRKRNIGGTVIMNLD